MRTGPTLLVALALALAAPSAHADTSPAVAHLKRQHFDQCRRFTVAEALESYLGSPRWEFSRIADNGHAVINVFGQMMFRHHPADVVVQFSLNEDADRFNIIGLWIDQNRQSETTITDFVSNLCDNLR